MNLNKITYFFNHRLIYLCFATARTPRLEYIEGRITKMGFDKIWNLC